MHQDSTAPEEWRAVAGYEGWYEVSDRGRVRRVKAGPRTYVGRILKPQIQGRKPGYWGVRLWKNTGRGVTKKIHLLMADAFMSPKPSPLHEINHRDLDSRNNLLTNLEWMLHADNVRHAFQGGAVGDRRGAKNANARLSEADILAIRLSNAPHVDLAHTYEVSVSTIAAVRQLKTWQNIHAVQTTSIDSRRGTGNSHARLTEDDVREIRSWPPEVMHADLAHEYGVSPETIRSIRLRKTWQHVD